MSQESISRPHSTVYAPRVQFISQDYSSFPMTTVYVPSVEFMSQEYSLFPKRQFISNDYSLCS